MWFKNLRFYTVDLSELNGVLKDDALVEEALEKLVSSLVLLKNWPL